MTSIDYKNGFTYMYMYNYTVLHTLLITILKSVKHWYKQTTGTALPSAHWTPLSFHLLCASWLTIPPPPSAPQQTLCDWKAS